MITLLDVVLPHFSTCTQISGFIAVLAEWACCVGRVGLLCWLSESLKNKKQKTPKILKPATPPGASQRLTQVEKPKSVASGFEDFYCFGLA